MHEKIKDKFVELREHWFNEKLREYLHERESEDEERAIRREEYNAEIKAEYDKQTDKILLGEDYPIAPSCVYDLLVIRENDDENMSTM